MKRTLLLSIVALALPLAAQQTPAPAAATPAPAPKQAAIVNGEVITAEKLDHLWNNMSVGIRDQYEKSGGKQAFLENYLRKRLVLQEAIKSGFDKRPDVITDMEAARESALFDRYVRDVVAAPFVSEADIKTYYQEHAEEFAMPERVHARHIVVTPQEAGPATKTKEQALERIKLIAADLVAHNLDVRRAESGSAARLRLTYFAEAARKYSEDGSASSGGDLGWKAKGELDPAFEEAAWNLQPGMMSGVIETQYGYHIIMVEERQPAGTEPYEIVRPGVREYLLTQKATEVMTAVNKLTNELRMTSKVTLFPENVK
ncbi:MAG: peptidylprolyl isomerase [Acidobacteriota bacterium]